MQHGYKHVSGPCLKCKQWSQLSIGATLPIIDSCPRRPVGHTTENGKHNCGRKLCVVLSVFDKESLAPSNLKNRSTFPSRQTVSQHALHYVQWPTAIIRTKNGVLMKTMVPLGLFWDLKICKNPHWATGSLSRALLPQHEAFYGTRMFFNRWGHMTKERSKYFKIHTPYWRICTEIFNKWPGIVFHVCVRSILTIHSAPNYSFKRIDEVTTCKVTKWCGMPNTDAFMTSLRSKSCGWDSSAASRKLRQTWTSRHCCDHFQNEHSYYNIWLVVSFWIWETLLRTSGFIAACKLRPPFDFHAEQRLHILHLHAICNEMQNLMYCYCLTA